MTSNSRADIIEKMKEGSITRGWGAVCVFNRERLNRVLQQQWLEKYDGTHFLPIFSGRMDLNDAKTEYGVLKNVMLGKPLLSFEPARLDNSKAKLTLSILGGNFSAFEKTYGLMYEFDITEAHGYTVTVELDLSLVVGVVDRLGRVTLDLSKGTKFACNLAGPTASQEKIGAYFDARFKELPPERQVYELGILNLKGRSDLTPTNFIVLTQRAPGAEVAGARNASDGAVVVMVKLRGDAMGGEIPSPERFPYLIPDDGDYSATMVLAEKYVSRSDNDKLALIQSLLFPGQRNVFVEHSREIPKDMVIFGSLDPSKTSITIEPAVHVLKAGGGSVEYKAYLNGTQTSVTWSVKSLNSNTSAGTINATSGLYQPVSSADLGKELVRNIVMASYEDPETKQKHEVRALLLVTTQSMTISPAAVPRLEGQQSKPVTFVATALSGATLTWKQPTYGSLSPINNSTAIYIPPSASQLLELPEFTVVDTIVAEDDTGETVEASVVLTRSAITLEIDPPFVNGVARSGTVSFTEGAPAGIERTWSVIGDGTVTSEGVYTAPSTTSRPYDIVRCEINFNGMLFFAGYSIVKLDRHTEEPGWTDLSKFSLEALRSERLFANGYQQLPLEAIIQTNGARLTLEEEASLRMYYVSSNQQVSEVPALQEGIEVDPELPQGLWAQSRIPNRFKPYPGSRVAQTEPGSQAELPSRVGVFMVSRDAQPTRFYAVFDDTQGIPWRSDVFPGQPEGIITLEPVPPPTANIENYKLERQRVEGGGGSDPDSDYDFDYFLKTTDYWRLTYRREGQVGVNFQAAEVRGLQSIVQWESPAGNETMFSYTGYAYNDPIVEGDSNVMNYDQVLVDNLGIEVNHEVLPGYSLDEGVFKIGLFRCDHNDGIRQDRREALHPLRNTPLKVYLSDDEGNHHELAIGFHSADRNRLYIDHLDGKNLYPDKELPDNRKTDRKVKTKIKTKARTKNRAKA